LRGFRETGGMQKIVVSGALGIVEGHCTQTLGAERLFIQISKRTSQWGDSRGKEKG